MTPSCFTVRMVLYFLVICFLLLWSKRLTMASLLLYTPYSTCFFFFANFRQAWKFYMATLPHNPGIWRIREAVSHFTHEVQPVFVAIPEILAILLGCYGHPSSIPSQSSPSHLINFRSISSSAIFSPPTDYCIYSAPLFWCLFFVLSCSFVTKPWLTFFNKKSVSMALLVRSHQNMSENPIETAVLYIGIIILVIFLVDSEHCHTIN